jgi:carboxyl-terminal processing protease
MKSRKLVLFVLLLVWIVPLGATTTEIPVAELKPTNEQRQSTLIINKVLSKYHYKRHSLDNSFSAVILERYLDSLDPNKRYFTQSDIAEFSKYEKRIDDSLRWASLDPPFIIFRTFRQRVEERITYALELLKQDFDFSVDENYLFDREDAPWAGDTKELDDLWRKQVKNDILGLRLTDKKMDEIRETLNKRYSGIMRRTNQMDSSDIYRLFINAYTLSIEPHTSYMPPREAENFDISMRLSLEGIGAVLQLEDEYTEVQKTVPGGPAAQSGEIHSGDRITGVAQDKSGEMVDVVGWRLEDVVDLIRGPKGTTVRLEILAKDAGSNGPTKIVTLVRNKIKLEDQAAHEFTIEGLEGMAPLRIGVIEVPAFYRDFRGQAQGSKDFRSTTRDVRKLLQKLVDDGVDGIIIDLRQNGGGSLVEATELTGLFIPSGPVVQVRSSNGDVVVEDDSDPTQVYAGPLAVLVDRYSASASEIFAGAIQDYGRGIIIGEPTFGKGTVQSLIELDRFVHNPRTSLGRLRITMAQFFRVNGGSTQFRGVVPDVAFPTASSSEDEGERSLDNALPWAKIDAAKHISYELSPPQDLQRLHDMRVKSDTGFKYLQNEERLLREIRERKLLSLQEKKRRDEWEQREQSRKQRENHFRTSVGLPLLSKEQSEDDEMSSEEEIEAIKRIGSNEAARILSDYIAGSSPKAVMAQ